MILTSFLSPEIIVPLILFVVIAIVGSNLLFVYNRKRALPEEQNKTPIFSERCGGRIGMYQFDSKDIQIDIYDTFFVLSYHKKIAVPYSTITNLEIKFSFGEMTKSIIINCDSPGLPKTVVLWANNQNKLFEILESKCKK